MIIRRCSQGHRIRVHRNTTPNAVRQKTYADGTVETLTYPSSYIYFVEVDGTVAKRSNSYKTAEEYFVSECAKKHDDGHGRVLIGKHKLINGVATSSSDYPSLSNLKTQIQDFLSKRGISYLSNETKSQLIEKVDEVKPKSLA